MEKNLPIIPAKRYFTIGEVGALCGVKPYILRYWEQEFSQLRPMKRRGNRRYYQHHEVLLVRRIRELLYEEGFTINGARNQLISVDLQKKAVEKSIPNSLQADLVGRTVVSVPICVDFSSDMTGGQPCRHGSFTRMESQPSALDWKSVDGTQVPLHDDWLKSELKIIRDLLVI